ncbi:HNH endonuclease [Candidatus Terasakiella magnetica]|uniref:HNH endonuclease n=1 Tax=Candidatus Terasakiella magnetica TaxID=1867952 RepID=A0A1C3RDQ8_9PROT|nr:HNH endonuclease [Candidatus Terasakiella magnetica]SCA55430.1 HNH endonuclease [Candidatus Terasakiella magnetica]
MQVAQAYYPALVLNADFRPLSYFPLSLWSWQEAIRNVFIGRVRVVSQYDTVVHSPSCEMRLPSVLVLKEYAKPPPGVAFTRFNLFLRDMFSCQYCGIQLPAHDLTFDHVRPRCRGGRTHWENIVTACRPCNAQKGQLSIAEAQMELMTRPYQPSAYELREHGRFFPPNHLHESWRDFLYWDSELDEF